MLLNLSQFGGSYRRKLALDVIKGWGLLAALFVVAISIFWSPGGHKDGRYELIFALCAVLIGAVVALFFVGLNIQIALPMQCCGWTIAKWVLFHFIRINKRYTIWAVSLRGGTEPSQVSN